MATDESPSRYILGVNAGFHDASAALLRDGALVAMAEQERLSRRKHAFFEPPVEAIADCLARGGIGLGEVTEIAVGWDMPAMTEAEGAGPFEEEEFAAWMLGGLDPGGASRPPLRFVDHHLAHAASAFHTSGFEEAAVLVVDGRGESVATTLAVAGPAGIEVLDSWGVNESLGFLYAMAAEWAGMRMRDAGKLMGLAAYGRPGQPVPLAGTPRGYEVECAPPATGPGSEQFRLLRKRLREGFASRNYPFGPGDPRETMAHADFAASIQRALEESLLGLARRARRESGQARLVLAGGVALNCTANGALLRSGLFEEIWVPPFPHDAGVSLGAALATDRAAPGRPAATPERLAHALWGAGGDEADAETLELLAGCELSRHGDDQLAELVARRLAEGKLVGWCQGRAEVGQRALGARSVLCDPRRREALVRTNLVKGRETWRPLAPAVLAERAGELFDGALPAAAAFMLAALPVREQAQAALPAAVHVDGSARPQAVGPEPSRYRATIEAFGERTGVPALINTSFNLAGEPIVSSARDAARTFAHSGLDMLVLGDLVAEKPAAKADGAQRTAEARGAEPRDPEMRFAPPWARSRARHRQRDRA